MFGFELVISANAQLGTLAKCNSRGTSSDCKLDSFFALLFRLQRSFAESHLQIKTVFCWRLLKWFYFPEYLASIIILVLIKLANYWQSTHMSRIKRIFFKTEKIQAPSFETVEAFFPEQNEVPISEKDEAPSFYLDKMFNLDVQ